MYKHAAILAGLVLTSTAQAFAQQPAVSYERPASWKYASEQEWIVNDITSTIAALSGHERSTLESVRVATLPPNGRVDRFQVEAGTEQTIIEIHDHIWSAGNYSAFARKEMRGRMWQPQDASALLGALTTPRVEVIEAVNRDLGHRMSQGVFTRGDQEDAALLIGVMALREGPGRFSDVRHLLSLMTAHLAIAQSIEGVSTKSGYVAELVQLALVNRQKDVLDGLAKWESASPSPSERSWIRALKLRVTGDWRLLEHPENASLLERIEYVRALEERRGPNAVLDFLDATHAEDIVDWTRILQYSMTVEASHRFSEDAAVGELRDAAYVLSKLSGETATVDETVKDALSQLNSDLSAEAGSTPALPIDWPTWVASSQRHLAADAVAAVELESHFQGRKNVARDMATKMNRLLGQLPLFPFAKLQFALDDVQRADAMKAVIGLMQRRPETITSANWRSGVELRNGRVPSGVTPQSVWFTMLVPAGTAYDAAHRVRTYQDTNHLTRESLDEVRRIAPYTRYLLEEEMRWRYEAPLAPPFPEYKSEAGVLADYDVFVMSDVLGTAKPAPADYVPLAQRLCHLQAEKCSALGHYLADHERDDEAAQVYQYWVDNTRDEVDVANNAGWLINYYYAHGQRSRARELADKGAKVFSYGGLKIKARVLERDGNYQEAEATLKQAIERYDKANTTDLAAFYVRWNKAFADPGTKTAAEVLVGKIFPRGLEHVDIALLTLTGPPPDGGRLTTIGERGERAGFALDDIVVAIDGIRVHNYDQLHLAWYMDADPEIAFIVWRDKKYLTIHGPLREAWRNWYVKTYRAASN
jgi:hypothetical protein